MTAPVKIGDFVKVVSANYGCLGHSGEVEKVNNLTAEVVVALRKLQSPKVFAHKRISIKDVEHAVRPMPIIKNQVCKCCGKPL